MSEERHYVGIFTVDEVPKTYTTDFPNELPKFMDGVPSQAPFKKLYDFPITALVHNTHTEQKEGICQKPDGKARFKANEKLLKATSRRICTDGQPKDLIKDDKLLPGKYVWFSMKPTLPEDSEFNKKDYNVWYVNGTTFYGPWSFTFDYSKLISSYKEHIQNHSDPGKRDATVVLRNGGTLKYQREICYVVIVTHSEDTMHEDATRYPIIENEEVLTITKQQHGDMSLPMCVFHPRCVPAPTPPPSRWKWYEWAKLVHYDHVVFAINCDWEGEIMFESEVMPPKPKCARVGEVPPVFKITLSPGEPHNYFEDCEDGSKEAYSEYHPICHRYEKESKYPSCYLYEYTQWLNIEMPNKRHKVAAIACEMKMMIEKFRDCTPTRIEAVQKIKRIKWLATMVCVMARKIIQKDVKEIIPWVGEIILVISDENYGNDLKLDVIEMEVAQEIIVEMAEITEQASECIMSIQEVKETETDLMEIMNYSMESEMAKKLEKLAIRFQIIAVRDAERNAKIKEMTRRTIESKMILAETMGVVANELVKSSETVVFHEKENNKLKEELAKIEVLPRGKKRKLSEDVQTQQSDHQDETLITKADWQRELVQVMKIFEDTEKWAKMMKTMVERDTKDAKKFEALAKRVRESARIMEEVTETAKQIKDMKEEQGKLKTSMAETRPTVDREKMSCEVILKKLEDNVENNRIIEETTLKILVEYAAIQQVKIREEWKETKLEELNKQIEVLRGEKDNKLSEVRERIKKDADTVRSILVSRVG